MNFSLKLAILLLIFFQINTTSILAKEVIVGAFSKAGFSKWIDKKFISSTVYKLENDHNRNVVKAISKASSSGKIREVKIDLLETPFINWSWKVMNTYKNINEKLKKGDDFPARIYLIVKTGIFPWNTKVINYVWSSYEKVGTYWQSSYSEEVHIMVVNQGNKKLGKWVQHKRNVIEDLKICFNKNIEKVVAVALMVDSDDSHQSAISYFGDISFSN